MTTSLQMEQAYRFDEVTRVKSVINSAKKKREDADRENERLLITSNPYHRPLKFISKKRRPFWEWSKKFIRMFIP